MRCLWCAAGLILLTFTAPGLGQEEESFDLRGPAPLKGRIYTSSGFFTIKHGKSVIKLRELTVKNRITEKTSNVTEIKVLAVKDRQVSRCRTRIITDVTTTKDDEGTSTTTSPLEGESFISEWSGPRRWKHSLLDARPTESQKKKLDDMTGPDNDDALYPAGKVKVGHTWTADASGLVNFFDASFSSISGTLSMKFVRLEDVAGESCAVIEGKGVITAKTAVDGGQLDTKLEMTRTVWRSLKTGMDVKDRATGTITFSGKLNLDGEDTHYLIEGPFEAEGNTKVK